MTPEEKNAWLELHLPSRFRAARAHTEIKFATGDTLDRYARDAVQLGRLIAVRWLIEFVGIKADKHGRPAEHSLDKVRRPHDTRIDKLGGTILATTSCNAEKLAKVWSATSKAVGHPTHGSGHHSLDLNVIVEAIDILQEHIQKTLYKERSLELFIGSP